jgi:secondary thiamine-phosphate synthase enzyme
MVEVANGLGTRSAGSRRVREPVAPVGCAPVHTEIVRLKTGSRRVTDLTSRAAAFVAGQGDGLLHVFVPHATAGVALFELGSGSEEDLSELLDRLLPRDDRYGHRHGSPGHGADHVLPVLVSPSVVVPVLDGRLALGTWQSVALVDTNVDNPDRSVRFTFVTGLSPIVSG